MKKQGIIFDMDGTLWDSAANVAESWNEAIRQDGRLNKALTETDIKGVMGKTMDVIAKLLFPEISEKEQPLWQVWSAEECDAGLTVETVGENLILQKKAKLTADSEEGKDFRAMYAGDGNHTDETLRWSSENDWENNDHWLMADFGEPVNLDVSLI